MQCLRLPWLRFRRPRAQLGCSHHEISGAASNPINDHFRFKSKRLSNTTIFKPCQPCQPSSTHVRFRRIAHLPGLLRPLWRSLSAHELLSADAVRRADVAFRMTCRIRRRRCHVLPTKTSWHHLTQLCSWSSSAWSFALKIVFFTASWLHSNETTFQTPRRPKLQANHRPWSVKISPSHHSNHL